MHALEEPGLAACQRERVVSRLLERRLRLNDNVMRVMTVIAGPEWEEPAAEGETATAAVTESSE